MPAIAARAAAAPGTLPASFGDRSARNHQCGGDAKLRSQPLFQEHGVVSLYFVTAPVGVTIRRLAAGRIGGVSRTALIFTFCNRSSKGLRRRHGFRHILS